MRALRFMGQPIKANHRDGTAHQIYVSLAALENGEGQSTFPLFRRTHHSLASSFYFTFPVLAHSSIRYIQLDSVNLRAIYLSRLMLDMEVVTGYSELLFLHTSKFMMCNSTRRVAANSCYTNQVHRNETCGFNVQ